MPEIKNVQDECADEYHETLGLNVLYRGFKMDVEPFGGNLKFRQAFNHTIDCDLIWDVLMEGYHRPGGARPRFCR